MDDTTWAKIVDHFGRFPVIAALAMALGALSGSVGGGVAALLGAAIGLVWAFLARAVAGWVNRGRDRRERLRDIPPFLACLALAALFGGGLIQHVLAGSSTRAFYALSQPPFGDGQVIYFIVLNSLMEWLVVPAALFVSWYPLNRRSITVAAAACFYLERLVSYLYFVPTRLGWGDSTDPPTAEPWHEVEQWMNLDWFRGALNLAALCLFLFVLSRPAHDRPAGVQPAQSSDLRTRSGGRPRRNPTSSGP